MSRSRRVASSKYCAQLLAAADEDDEIDAIIRQDRNDNFSDASDDSACVSDDDEGDEDDDEDEEEAGAAVSVRTKGNGPATKKRKLPTAWTLQQIPVDRNHALDSLKAIPGHSDEFGDTGPHFPRGAEKTPLGCFKLFFTDALAATIATNSNAYASDVDDGLNLTPAELYRWIGIVLIRSIRRPRRTRAMWSSDTLDGITGLSNILPRDRFEAIFRHLHISDHTKDEANSEEDNLCRTREMITVVERACRTHYKPPREVAIDEMTIPFKGHCKYLHLFKSKPHGSGGALRVDALCCSDTGYCYLFCFECDNTRAQVDAAAGITSGLRARVLWLVDELPTPYHRIYMDNPYVNEPLLQMLRKKNHYALGTIRSHIQPNEIAQKRESNKERREEKEGTLKIALNADKTVAAFSYYDKNPVHMMTTYRASFQTDEAPRTKRERPLAVTDYNNYMNAVDRNDQYRWQNPTYMRSVKWWKTVFFFLLDISLINAFILYKAIHDAPLTFADYRRILINELTSVERPAGDTDLGPMRPGPRHVSGHFVHRRAEKHTLRPYKRGRDERQPKSRYCHRTGCLSRTKFYCADCNVPFCNVTGRECFNVVHGLVSEQEEGEAEE